MHNRDYPRLMALFKKMFEGDDALLQLASLRFQESGLGAEFYAETLDELGWLFGFIPSPESPVVVHLHRNIKIDLVSGVTGNQIPVKVSPDKKRRGLYSLNFISDFIRNPV